VFIALPLLSDVSYFGIHNSGERLRLGQQEINIKNGTLDLPPLYNSIETGRVYITRYDG
jgi:hypothetical protein